MERKKPILKRSQLLIVAGALATVGIPILNGMVPQCYRQSPLVKGIVPVVVSGPCVDLWKGMREGKRVRWLVLDVFLLLVTLDVALQGKWWDFSWALLHWF